MDPQFPETPWTLIAQAQGDFQDRQAALQQLLQSYWQPVYATLVGAWSLQDGEARELAEQFIRHVLSPDVIRSVDGEKLRFRDFLREQLQAFMQDSEHREPRRESTNRGLELEEALPLPPSRGEPREVFNEQWILLMFHRALRRLQDSCEKEREALWAVFHAVDVEGKSLETAAGESDLKPEQASALLFRARHQFRRFLIVDLGNYCTDVEQTREELQWLLN